MGRRAEQGNFFHAGPLLLMCHFVDNNAVFRCSRFWRKTGRDMKKIMAVLLLFGCWGCSGGVYTDFAEVGMRLGYPAGDGPGRVPVLYPGRPAAEEDPMVQAFGSSWKNMEDDYPAYNFNP